jgi:hypothetical protein
MPCEHCVGGKYPLCEAVQGLMAPSLADMEEYCTSDDPSRCPLYRQYVATHAKVSLEAAAVLTDQRLGNRNGERRFGNQLLDVEEQPTIAVRATQRARH